MPEPELGGPEEERYYNWAGVTHRSGARAAR